MGRFILKHVVKLVAVGIILFITASIAQAGWDAYTTADVNMREGPGNRHRVIVVIPEGEPVYVHECPGRWCDVEWGRYRGFVYGRYLSSSGSGYYEGYVVPPPVIVTPDYDGGYIHVPRKRRHYDRHKRKRKHLDLHKRKREHLDRHKRKRKHLDRQKRKRKFRRYRSREDYDRPSRSRKHHKRSKRRKSFEQSRKRRSYKRSEKRRSMLRNSRRSKQRFERRRNRGEGRRGSQRRRNNEREDDD